jgi:hypothetical protein
LQITPASGSHRPDDHPGPAPPQGNLFDNLLGIEARKYRAHRGKRGNLHFWRDAKGNEVDLVIESGPEVMPVEIKLGAPIRADFFKGLRTFAGRLATPPALSAVVYGGNEQQPRSDIGIWQARDVAEMMGRFC